MKVGAIELPAHPSLSAFPLHPSLLPSPRLPALLLPLSSNRAHPLFPLFSLFFLPPCSFSIHVPFLQDPRAAARYGERVPYVVVCGEPGARLVDLVLSPHDVLRAPHKYKINARYYITKQLVR